VGDNSYSATRHDRGGRYRLELADDRLREVHVGTRDARRYFFKTKPSPWRSRVPVRPIRRRRGKLRQDLAAFLGEETLIRGYGTTLLSECDQRGSIRRRVAARYSSASSAANWAVQRRDAHSSPRILGFGCSTSVLPLESRVLRRGHRVDRRPESVFKFVARRPDVPQSCANSRRNKAWRPTARLESRFSTGVTFRMKCSATSSRDVRRHPFQRNYNNWVVGILAAPGW